MKESIDKEQNELIKQLQENKLALTEGLDKNRLAITQGFDKMDEVKKWDLQQLPGYEAIEEPEDYKEEEPEETEKELEEYKKDYDLYENENTKFKILSKDLNFITGTEDFDKRWFEFTRKDLEDILEKHGFNNQNKYFLNITDSDEKILRLEKREKEPKKVITFEKSELDKYLLNDKNSNKDYVTE